MQGEVGPRLVSGQLLSRPAGELTARGNGAIPPAYSSSSSCLPYRHVGARRYVGSFSSIAKLIRIGYSILLSFFESASPISDKKYQPHSPMA